jgi:molybdopterin/thiamine biosynthesis adenylyltransferase
VSLGSRRVLLVGAGGLGSPVGILLARAGVGRIEVLDDDVVETGNLHRQLLFTAADIGQPKAERAAAALRREAVRAGHAQTQTVACEGRLVPDNALERVRGFDLVVEGTDNYPSKFLVADACALAEIPCVHAGAVRWVGWALGSVPGDGQSACLRCAFEDVPPGPDRGCAEAGVLGPVVGVIGAIQAAIALRILLGDVAAAGVLHHYRALHGGLRRQRIARAAHCDACRGQLRALDAARYAPQTCVA